MEPSFTNKEEDTQEHGRTIKCMEKEHCTMPIMRLLIKVIGLKIICGVMEHYTIKIHNL